MPRRSARFGLILMIILVSMILLPKACSSLVVKVREFRQIVFYHDGRYSIHRIFGYIVLNNTLPYAISDIRIEPLKRGALRFRMVYPEEGPWMNELFVPVLAPGAISIWEYEVNLSLAEFSPEILVVESVSPRSIPAGEPSTISLRIMLENRANSTVFVSLFSKSGLGEILSARASRGSLELENGTLEWRNFSLEPGGRATLDLRLSIVASESFGLPDSTLVYYVNETLFSRLVGTVEAVGRARIGLRKFALNATHYEIEGFVENIEDRNITLERIEVYRGSRAFENGTLIFSRDYGIVLKPNDVISIGPIIDEPRIRMPIYWIVAKHTIRAEMIEMSSPGLEVGDQILSSCVVIEPRIEVYRRIEVPRIPAAIEIRRAPPPVRIAPSRIEIPPSLPAFISPPPVVRARLPEVPEIVSSTELIPIAPGIYLVRIWITNIGNVPSMEFEIEGEVPSGYTIALYLTEPIVKHDPLRGILPRWRVPSLDPGESYLIEYVIRSESLLPGFPELDLTAVSSARWYLNIESLLALILVIILVAGSLMRV